eukprot:jgi/Botrbrau1/15670/Bobra.4_1s0052.2
MGWIRVCNRRYKWVVISNFSGIVLGVYFTLVAYGYANDTVRRQLEVVILVVVLTLLASSSVTVLDHLSRSAGILLWGIVCNVILAFYWTAPLSSLYQVLRTRSAVTLYWPLSATNLICSSLWTTYGFVLSQPFLWAPNGAGVLLSIFQLCLIIIFPRTPPLVLEAGFGPDGQADVRIKLTLDLQEKDADGKPTFTRQWSEGQWTDISGSAHGKAPIAAARARRKGLLKGFGSSLELLLSSSRRSPSSTSLQDEELASGLPSAAAK